jgi:hypothetical protein
MFEYLFENAEVIHRYTRAGAIRDGVLIDVSQTAREAGVRHPVALTRALWCHSLGKIVAPGPSGG